MRKRWSSIDASQLPWRVKWARLGQDLPFRGFDYLTKLKERREAQVRVPGRREISLIQIFSIITRCWRREAISKHRYIIDWTNNSIAITFINIKPGWTWSTTLSRRSWCLAWSPSCSPLFPKSRRCWKPCRDGVFGQNVSWGERCGRSW